MQIENCLFSNNAGELRKAYHLERVLQGSEDWIFAMDLDGTERILYDNKELQRRECVETNYKSKKGSKTNPVKSYELLLYDLTHFSMPMKLMLCLL